MLSEEFFFELNSNQIFPLVNPEQILIIESGLIAIFSIGLEDGIPNGRRRYLFTPPAGSALFGSSAKNQRIFCAVSLEDARFQTLTPNQFARQLSKFSESNGNEATELIECWIRQLGLGMSQIPSPVPHFKAIAETPNVLCTLESGQILQVVSTSVLWISIHQGEMQMCGLDETHLTSAHRFYPMTEGMWLTAKSAVEFSIYTAQTIAQTEDNLKYLLQGVSEFQNWALQSIDVLEKLEQLEEFNQFSEHDRLNRQVTQQAIEGLASVLDKQPASSLSVENPTLAAVGAVARSLDISIQSPRATDLQRAKSPIEAIARSSRIRVRQVLLEDKWWRKDCGPMLAHRGVDQSPVAILPDRRAAERYSLFDPERCDRAPITAEVAATLQPIAYTFYRPLPDRAIKVWTLLQFAIKGLRPELLMILFIGIIVALLGMLTPQMTSILIDTAIPSRDYMLLFQIGFALSISALCSLLFQVAQGFALLRLESQSDAATQPAIWDRLLNQKLSFFRQYSVGDLKARVLNISQIRQILSGTTLRTIFASLFSLLNLVLLIYYSTQLAMVAIAVAIVTAAVTIASSTILIRKVLPLEELSGEIFGMMVQLMNGISKLRVSGSEARAFNHWSKRYSVLLRLQLSTQAIEDAVVLFNTVLPTVTSVLLFWLASGLVIPSPQTQAAPLSIGTFLAFNAAFGTFLGGANTLSNSLVNVLRIVPLQKRAQPILNALPEVDAQKADPGILKGKVAIQQVKFRYRQDTPLVLDNVSLYADPGEFVAIVGASGGGKSTLFRMLLGFEEPDSGQVYYDNQDLADLDAIAVRRQLGVVIQNSRITTGSIFENIAGNSQITQDEVWDAVQMAGLENEVRAMPMQLHTVISEGGSNLSGGQRQRLLIAKALVMKPKIILFDEATSALDNRSQAIVSQSLKQLEATRIVIAHRLSTIRDADRIYVLESGRIIQEGNFQQLANAEGTFAQLMARQMI